MKIELVEFYPEKGKEDFVGTLHIYLYELMPGSNFAIDLRGIGVRKKKKHFFFIFPRRKGFDSPTSKYTYDVINFSDPSYREEILRFLHSKETKGYISNILDEKKPKK